MNLHLPIRRLLPRLAGLVILVAAWQILGATGVTGKTLPAFTDVLHIYTLQVRRALLLRAASATIASAALGLAIGSCLGCLTALAAYLLPILSPGLNRMAVVVNAVPAIALGPILIVTAGREETPILLAAIPVYFLLYVAATAGLTSADRRHTQLFLAAGATRIQRLIFLDAIYAIPALLNGLKLGVPTAIIGAVVGEWFGAPTGLGIVILNTMQNFQIPLMWATVLVVAAISLSIYGILGLAERAAQRRFA